MANIRFTDNSVQVADAIDKKALAWLYEVAGELVSRTQRNSRTDSGQLKGSWSYNIDESAMEGKIGSPLENAIWEEFGTGEYAAKGDGRKGGWYIPEDRLSTKAKGRMQRVKIKGKVFYHTYGKKANHALQRAFDSLKNKATSRAKQIFAELTVED